MGDATFGGAPWLVKYLGVQLGGAPSDTGAAPPSHPLTLGGAPPFAPPLHPLQTGAAPPGFGGAPPALEVHPLAPPRTLKGVGLWNITDVLEFPSTLMEQRTLDARGVRCWTLEYYRCT